VRDVAVVVESDPLLRIFKNPESGFRAVIARVDRRGCREEHNHEHHPPKVGCSRTISHDFLIELLYEWKFKMVQYSVTSKLMSVGLYVCAIRGSSYLSLP